MLTLPHTKLTSLDVKYEIICDKCFKLCLVETKCCIKLYKCSTELKKNKLLFALFLKQIFAVKLQKFYRFFYLFKENQALLPLYV